MNFEVSELTQQVAQTARDFARQHIKPHVMEWDESQEFPIEVFKRAFRLCREHNLRLTANYMVGLPHETEEDVYETIKLNRLLNPPSIAVTYFTPFMGTELYDTCIKNDFYQPFQENVYEYPPLKMPQLSQERIVELVKEFTDDFKGYQKDFSIV